MAIHARGGMAKRSGRVVRHMGLTFGAVGAVLSGLTCSGGDITTPTTGSLEITTATSGAEPDADGYAVTIDTGAETTTGVNGTLRRDNLEPGSHTVRLTGIAPNCTLEGENPRTVEVASGTTATVSFTITCGASTGSLEITTTTTGSLPDPDGYSVSVDGGAAQSIGINATLTVANLAPGSHSVALAGMASNCGIGGDNPRSVTVTAGTPATTTFSVSCHLTQGTKIAFESDRGGSFDVFVMNIDGTEQRNLTSNPAVDDIGPWSPDGTKLAFTSDRDTPFSTDIFVMNADGSGQTNLTRHAENDDRPVWSPDGQKIAFDSNRDGNHQIYVMNADGSGQTRLTNTVSGSSGPTWSPDGRWISFHREGRMFLMKPDGSGQTAITSPSNTELDGGPGWSPDGSKIAFERTQLSEEQFDPSEVTNLWIMNPDGSGLMALTHYSFSGETDGTKGFSWNPDGTKLVFASSIAGAYDIWVIRPDGTGLTNLTNSHNVHAYSPLWSPDGTRILLSGIIGNVGPDVFVMDTDGGHLTNLTNNPAWDGAPTWQP